MKIISERLIAVAVLTIILVLSTWYYIKKEMQHGAKAKRNSFSKS